MKIHYRSFVAGILIVTALYCLCSWAIKFVELQNAVFALQHEVDYLEKQREVDVYTLNKNKRQSDRNILIINENFKRLELGEK